MRFVYPRGLPVFTFCSALLLALPVQAHPYASGITNTTGTISYILNENADDVKVAFDNGTSTNSFGPLAAGVQSFALGTHTNFSIVVSKVASGAFTQISVDATNNSFFGPRGVAVNRNPKNGYFGRVYICNANGGILNSGPTNKVTGRGIYIVNADTSDALGRGTNASLAGMSLGSSTTYSPFKCFVGPDDRLYVGDGSGVRGSGTGAVEPVSMFDPDVTTVSNIFVSGSNATNNNAGPVTSTPVVSGSLKSNNLVLYCVTANFSSPSSTYNNVFRYNIGGGPVPWSNAPAVLGNAGSPTVNGQDGDLAIAPDGKIFTLQNRSTNSGVSIRVFDPTGSTQLWDSSSAGAGVDRFVDILGIAVSPDNAFLAAAARSGNLLLARLTNGLPDLSTLSTNTTGLGSVARSVAFDAADNVYMVSGGADRLRVFSLGLGSVAVTSNDTTTTNGSFQFTSTLSSPTIVSQPQSQTVATNANAVFTVGAAGATPLSYRWLLGGTALVDNSQVVGAQSNILTLKNVTVANAGSYRVIISNAVGSVTSAVATLTVTTSQPATWTQFANSPGSTSVRHDDICFVDPLHGWASQNNLIYRTVDGGATWTTSLNLSGTHFRSVAFATTNVGFAGNLGIGSYDGGVTNPNILYRTYDGGVTWSNVPGFAEVGMKGLCVLDVLDSQHIYGAGRVRGPAHFIKSNDGGTNWSIVSLTAMGVMNGIMDVYFSDPNNGWVVGMDTNAFAANCASTYYGRIARTTDGGNTWTPVVTTPIACSYFWKMSWPTTNIGYVSLQQNGSFNNIVFYKTTDGGNNWVSNGIPLSSVGLGASAFYIQGLGFVSANEGWIGGANSIGYAPAFLHTTDGGLTWSPAGYNNTYLINRIRFLSPTLGYMSGAALHIYSPPLAITSDPQSQVVIRGTNVDLNVTASGIPPIGYQWHKNGTNAIGATQSTLTLPNVTRLDAGLYSVVVTNGGSSLNSATAELRVLVPERLTAPTILPGGRLQLSFTDADGGALITTNDLNTFQVQGSTNMVDWTVLTNSLSITNGNVLFQDVYTNAPSRFYRVLEH